MLRWLLACALVARTTLAEVLDVSSLSDAELAEVAAAAREEMRKRQEPKSYPVFQYAHKQTFATSDPEGAAVFLRDHVGGTTNVTMTNTSHTCADGSLSGFTHIVDFPATADQPLGFTVHFVYNPHKPPFGTVPGTNVDAYTLGERVEAWRREKSGFARGVFDQFVDTHLGIAYESLDPIVDHWRQHDIPFICRTWCCGPGMPQYPDNCPRNRTNTEFCECVFPTRFCHTRVFSVGKVATSSSRTASSSRRSAASAEASPAHRPASPRPSRRFSTSARQHKLRDRITRLKPKEGGDSRSSRGRRRLGGQRTNGRDETHDEQERRRLPRRPARRLRVGGRHSQGVGLLAVVNGVSRRRPRRG